MGTANLTRAVGLGSFVLAACGGKTEATCPWTVDDLLAQASVAAPERADCGTFGQGQKAEIVAALGCFSAKVQAKQPVQLTINNCIDCLIPSTFVGTARGKIYQVEMEADGYGDDQREAHVRTCDQVVAEEFGPVHCSVSTDLYACQAPLSSTPP